MLDAAEALGFIGASPVAHLVKNLPANAGDARDVLALWVGRPLEEDLEAHSNILVCRIPWTEEPGKLQFVELDMTEYVCM